MWELVSQLAANLLLQAPHLQSGGLALHACRAHWAAQPVTAANIAENLAKTGNLPWVVEQCLSRAAPSAADQEALTQHGLQLSAAQAQGKPSTIWHSTRCKACMQGNIACFVHCVTRYRC